ncbi:MAG: DUF2269 domain-containing protein [gamma proteobacterium symbiont of Taylorina sp.]|nr:DUF2269 domain-containing protein [gamma proteobacterium symbiont of Taylorina sp.]
MMYLTVKFIHIISATLLFGTGLGSAFYMFMAYQSGNMNAMAETNRIVVIADFCFTTPTVIIQLVSGLYLLNYLGLEWTSPWSLSVLGLYLFVGACWLPVVWLQIWLRNRAEQLESPDILYRHRMKIWMILGILAFPAVIVLYAFMVYKPFFSI